jgi:hypothetical protein
MRWLRLFLVALALLGPPMAPSRPAAAAQAAEGESRAKLDRARIDRLRRQIKRLTEQSPLTVDRALAILGSQKGAGGATSRVNFQWKLVPTDLIDGGRIGTLADRAFVDIKPAAGLGLTFEDVASMFLHAPYSMRDQRVHSSEDSLGTRTQGIHHSFLVPAGELEIYLPTTVPFSDPLQMSHAWSEGRNAAKGLLPASARPLTSVIVSAWVGPLGEQPKTLAKLRAKAAKRATPPR